MDNTPERTEPTDESSRTNVLLETLRSEFRTFGEGLTAVQKRLGSVEAAVLETGRDVAWMTPIVKTLAPVPNQLQAIEVRIERIEKRLDTFDHRVGMVEAKVGL